MTRANLVPPIATASERTPQRPLSKALGKAPAVNPDRGNPGTPGKRSIGTERVQSRCRHRSCATRSPASGALGATTSPGGPRSRGVGGRSEDPAGVTASVSGPRSEGVDRSARGSLASRDQLEMRHPSAIAEATTSRRSTRQRQPFDARALPPQVECASGPEGPSASTTRIGSSEHTPHAPARPSGASPYEPCDHRSASPGSQDPMSPPHPSHLVRANQRLSSVSPRTTPHDPQGSTPEGCLDAARSGCDRSRSLHDVASCETCASATVRERNAPSE